MNANLRNFALWVIIVLLLLALFTLFQNPGQRTNSQDISFSQLLSRGRPGPRARCRDPGSGNSRHLRQWHQFPDLCAERSDAGAETLRQGRLDHRAAAVRQRAVVRLAAGVVAAVHRADRRVDFPVAADARRGRQGARLRQVARKTSGGGARPRHVRRRRRRRRSQTGPAGDRRIPARPGQIPAPRRPHPARRAAGRPSGHRQDADRARGRRRSQRALLHDFRLRLRRDVRRRRRLARARYVRAGQEERALHHLHRRNRCGRPSSRRRPRRRQ